MRSPVRPVHADDHIREAQPSAANHRCRVRGYDRGSGGGAKCLAHRPAAAGRAHLCDGVEHRPGLDGHCAVYDGIGLLDNVVQDNALQ